jgi:Crinkler effector protein N-terminal domain
MAVPVAVTLQLNCWVFGDDITQVFPIKIVNTESVGTLKEAIKDKKQPVLDHVTADSLTLWKVSVPANRRLQQALSSVPLTDETSLSAVDDLFEVFSDAPCHKHLHIVVKLRVGE